MAEKKYNEAVLNHMVKNVESMLSELNKKDREYVVRTLAYKVLDVPITKPEVDETPKPRVHPV